MIYDLPKTAKISGVEYSIRWDFRAVLEIITVLNDPDFTSDEKAQIMLYLFYPKYDEMPLSVWDEALKYCTWFIDCGDTNTKKKSPRLMDWEKDFPNIVAPVNRIIGQEIRGTPYDVEKNINSIHWWTFISAYQEIGDCFFAHIVRIRDMKARGKKLDKSDREFYNRNRDAIELRTKFSAEEEETIKGW